MKKLSFLLLAVSLFTLGACDDDDDDMPSPITNFTATLNGASENPANNSTATGSATGTFNSDTKQLNLTITYTGLTPTVGHIHMGAVGANGDPVFPFVSVASSPITFSEVLDATEEGNLMAGMYYVNLHSAAFPGGEIRGQLIKNP